MTNEVEAQLLGDVAATRERVDDMYRRLFGNGQKGDIMLIQERVTALEGDNIRRNTLDKVITVAVSSVISVAIALHSQIGNFFRSVLK